MMMRMRYLYTPTDPDSPIWMIGDAARHLAMSPSGVRHLEALGVLLSTRTPSGLRLDRRDDVERVARDRAAMRGARVGA